MRFTANGKLVRKSTCVEDKRLAEELYGRIRKKIRQGRYSDDYHGDRKTFAEATDRYMKDYSGQKALKSVLIDKVSLKHLLPVFGDKFLSQVTPDMIVRFKTLRRNEGAAASSINKELAFSKHLYNVAIKEWGWLRFNPFAQVSLERLPQPRDRHLTREEFDRLYQACMERLKPIVLIAVNTGMRQDEILSLTWQQVDFKNEALAIEHTKSGRRRSVPMIAPVKSLLLELGKVRHIDSQYVFPSTAGTKIDASKIRNWFRQACRKAGIENFRFHDLRHTCGSWLAQNGVDLYVVQRILGHSSSAMTQRYAHLVQGNLRAGLNTLIAGSDIKTDIVVYEGSNGNV